MAIMHCPQNVESRGTCWRSIPRALVTMKPCFCLQFELGLGERQYLDVQPITWCTQGRAWYKFHQSEIGEDALGEACEGAPVTTYSSFAPTIDQFHKTRTLNRAMPPYYTESQIKLRSVEQNGLLRLKETRPY